MNKTEAGLVRDLQTRVNEHFDSTNPEEVVRQSRELLLFPEDDQASLLPQSALDGPILMHPKPKSIPLNAYLASALTNLQESEKTLIMHLSDIISIVCRTVDIDLYEPRKKTDPVHNADVSDKEVFRIDRERVTGSDLLIHLCHFPSTGAGEELAFAYDALVPTILIIHDGHSVSRMITGIPCLKIQIHYQESSDMREMLEARLREIRPVLEQRKLAKADFSANVVGARVKELRLDASLTREQLAKSVGLDVEAIAHLEENIDTLSNPSLTHLRLLATALKTTVAELVNPDYTQSVLAGIQAMLDDRVTDAVAARFRGVPTRDQKLLMARYLSKLLSFVTDSNR